MRRYDFPDLARRLAAQAEEVALALFPAGQRVGNTWRVGSLAGEPGQSLCIWLSGAKRGRWWEFAEGRGGDLLALIQAAEQLPGVVEAAARAERLFGVGGEAESAPRRAMPTRPAEPPDQERERRRRSAKALWLGAAGGVLGTPVDTYLCGRGLDLRRLDDAAARLGLPPRAGGYRPRALRYLAQAACSGGLYPAMVACVLAGSGRFLGVHRTFLDPGGAGKAVLPDGGPAKRTLGPTGGGFVPIWRGASGRPWLHAPEGDELAICEGIEDALTLAMAAPELRVVAALSAGNLAALALPPAFGRLLIGADNDAPGSPADRSLAQAIRRWQSEGRSVRLARAGDGAKDFNARLLQRVKSAPSA